MSLVRNVEANDDRVPVSERAEPSVGYGLTLLLRMRDSFRYQVAGITVEYIFLHIRCQPAGLQEH